ncbi:MAG: FtsW/RodA/SpoVE family cell cycle protein [Ruminococcus sp.]|nr:FtsW/RodA/SpoVE family cell cycle protein [Ruminococcus sp.]MDD6634157.1 FtsW/RodA/SpoVE family cell cycle protein [Ruminococcus sp.]
MKSAFNELKNQHRHLDYGLLLAVIICSAVSSLLIYSIHANKVLESVGASYYRTQIISALMGLFAALVISLINYKKLARLWFLYVPVSVVLVLLTFTGLGYKRADDQAWLNLGFIQIQPSEVLKLAFILSFAYHLSRVEENMNKPVHMALLCLHGLVPIALVGGQGDYGTAIVFGFIFAAMIISAKISWKYLAAAPVLLAAALVFLWNFVLKSDHKNRIEVLLHPGTDPEGLEYQQDLGLAALNKGGFLGIGLFGDKNEYISVPEIHNDFILSYAGMVFGFVGAVGLLAILAYICLKILADSRIAKDNLGKFICMGTFGLILAHCIMNIGMVLKVMPVIGIPLPFLSAGGTAMVSMYVAIGLVLSTYTHSNKKYNVFYEEEE